MYERQLERLSKDIATTIEDELSRVGIFYRIFRRVKNTESTKRKIENKKYDGANSFMQDLIGIRVVLYFYDDVDLVYNQLKKLFPLIDETIDVNDESNFSARRINLIFKIPSEHQKEFSEIVQDEKIDVTFELQLRTFFSEGWHEIDHDLRYKCKSDWNENKDLSRTFNGILATLETSEWSIIALFEQLLVRHFEDKNYNALIRTKLRLRLLDHKFSKAILKLIDQEFAEKIIKIERSTLIKFLFESKAIVPLTMDNLLFIINYKFFKQQDLLNITPKFIIDELK